MERRLAATWTVVGIVLPGLFLLDAGYSPAFGYAALLVAPVGFAVVQAWRTPRAMGLAFVALSLVALAMALLLPYSKSNALPVWQLVITLTLAGFCAYGALRMRRLDSPPARS